MFDSRFARHLLAVVSVWLFCLVGPTSAFAHAELVNSSPAANAAIKSAPAELRLGFSERVEIAFSKVSFTGAAKEKVETGPMTLDAKDDKVLVVPVRTPLAPATYSVEWSVVSADGHKSKGGFHFTVE